MPNKLNPILALLCLILLGFTAYFMLALASSNALLEKIQIINPSTNIAYVENKLGKPMYVFSDKDCVLIFGSIKDASFCSGTKLYIFPGTGWPARALDVYTDKNDAVVYVSWHQL